MNSTQKKTFLIVTALILIGVGGYYAFHKNRVDNGYSSGGGETEITALVAEVGKLIVLPADETPTIATVTDPAALKDQPFFKNAQQGDKVLIYAQAQRAILYDPVAKKIIDVAPINVGAEAIPSTEDVRVPAEEPNEPAPATP